MYAPTNLEKIKGLSEVLLDEFIFLKEKYALLEPMIFDHSVIERCGAREATPGFKLLRHTLFLGLIQDIANIALDRDDRSPSLQNISRLLENGETKSQLRKAYSSYVLPGKELETDQAILEELIRIENERSSALGDEFDKYYDEFFKLWEELKLSSEIKSFKTIRDKVTAHTEINSNTIAYARLDIDSLNVKWKDPEALINKIHRLVKLCGYVARMAGFNWEDLDMRLKQDSQSFWA